MPSADPSNDLKPTLSPQLTLPRPIFAKIAPQSFLSTLLETSVRPSGRGPDSFRPIAINTGSLSFCAGSVVARVGDTAVVCGVQPEILLTRDIPNPPAKGTTNGQKSDQLAELGLLVPNVELATGCSSQFVPGQSGPPSQEAQGLTSKLFRSLVASGLMTVTDLEITQRSDSQLLSEDPATGDMELDGDGDIETREQTEPVAYWTLYISLHVLSLSGLNSLFDASWAAMVAALYDVRLPRAWWDPDRECVLCSDAVAESKRLDLQGRPLAMTWGIFCAPKDGLTIAEAPRSDREAGKPMKKWILADPDDFEDALCKQSITLVVDWSKDNKEPSNKANSQCRLISVDVRGGPGIRLKEIKLLTTEGRARWKELDSVLPGKKAGL